MTTTLLSKQILKIMRPVQGATDVSVWLTEYLSGVTHDRHNNMVKPVNVKYPAWFSEIPLRSMHS